MARVAVLFSSSNLGILAASAQTNAALRDIKPPVEIPAGWVWVWRVLAGLLLLALAYFLWRWKQNRPAPPPPPPVPPDVKARQGLQESLAFLPEPRQFCIRVSDVLRVYLEERFTLAAPERTTDEFLMELQGTTVLNSAQKLSLADFLQRCDLAKFARHEPAEQELLALHASASRLVEETAPRLNQEPEATQAGNQ